MSWRISCYDKSMAARVTPVEDVRNYDLSLYPFPLADFVPEELFEMVDHPIFPRGCGCGGYGQGGTGGTGV